MYRQQRYGGGGSNGYMGDQWGGAYNDRWQGGGMNNMRWGNMGNRKRPGFDLVGGHMFDEPFFNAPPAKMMRLDMSGFRRYGGKNQKRWGGKKKDKDAMKMADAIIEKHGGGGAKKGDAAGKAGESTKTGDKRKNKQEKPRKNPYNCHFCKIETNDKKTHSEHIRSPAHGNTVKRRENYLMDMMNTAYEISQRDVYNGKLTGRRIRFCNVCYLQFTGDPERHKKQRSHKNMEFNLRIRCMDCDCLQPTRFQYEKHLTSQQHIRNQMYRMIEDGKTEFDTLECPEEFDEAVDVGNHYVVDLKAVFCKVCNKMFPSKEQNAIAHCKTEEHFNNYKKFVEVEVVDREKRKEEEERLKKEEEERKLLESENTEEGAKEEDEEEKETTGEDGAGDEDNEDVGDNQEEEVAAEKEADGEEEMEATDEAAAEEEPAKVEEPAPAEEEEKVTPKRGRPTRRSARK